MNKFQNSKIYKITDNTSDMIYVGSTCKTLEQRLKQHVANNKSYKVIRGIKPNIFEIYCSKHLIGYNKIKIMEVEKVLI